MKKRHFQPLLDTVIILLAATIGFVTYAYFFILPPNPPTLAVTWPAILLGGAVFLLICLYVYRQVD